MDRSWAQLKIKLRIEIFSEKISRVVEFIRQKFEYFVGAEFDFDQHEWVWMDTDIKVPLVLWLKRFSGKTDVEQLFYDRLYRLEPILYKEIIIIHSVGSLAIFLVKNFRESMINW